MALFGIAPPRIYRGTDPEAASMVGANPLVGPLDLRVARFLSVALDGGPAVAIDCGAKATDRSAAAPEEITEAVNAALGSSVASVDGSHHVVITSPTSGIASEITISPVTSGNARPTLFGDVADVTAGSDPSSAPGSRTRRSAPRR